MRREGVFLILCLFVVICASSAARAADQAPESSFFEESLHATGEGMRYWYEEQGGFMEITKIPYAELGCKNCHVKSCDQCHASVQEDGKKAFSLEMAGKSETCYACHQREQLSVDFAKKAGHTDVHIAAGMSCAECHKDDVHGNGTKYTSMREPGAVSARCENCHEQEGSSGTVFNANTRSHGMHRGKLDCSACHVRRTMACYNCHFSNFLKTKTKKGNFVPTDDWLMLVNLRGKVTSATAMALVHEGKSFVTYAPYFTHDVMKKGRACEECHANDATALLAEGKKIPVAKFVDGKIEFWNGVIPLGKETLQWEFADKQDSKWVPYENISKPDLVQWSLYAEPLTEKQMEMMQAEQKSK